MSSVTKLIATVLMAGIAAPAVGQYQPYPVDAQPSPEDTQQYPQDEQSYPQYPSQSADPQEDEQYPGYQQPYSPYPQYPQTYPGYSYGQSYNDPVSAVIDQLLGPGYSASDRSAVRQCAIAAMAQSQGQNGAYARGYESDEGPYGSSLRLTAISSVERRADGLEVRGELSSGNDPYASAYGSYGQSYDPGSVSFRCKVDYRGVVTNVRLLEGSDEGY